MFKGNFDFDLNFWQIRSVPLIGIDISSSAVKMVELDKIGENKYRVERYAIELLPREAVLDGNINDFDAVSECVGRVWKKLGTRNKSVAMALPAAAVITKKIIVPAGQSEEDLSFLVETEANQYIPFALDEVNLDFQVIGPAPGNPDEVEVLIAASRKEKVEDRVATAEASGLSAIVMDVEPYASQTAFELIQRQFPNAGRDKTIAIVDIGASLMSINVLRNGQSVYMRDQPFGGNQLTYDIQHFYNLTLDEAEMAKRKGGLPDNYETEILRPFRENLALEVSRALQFFFTSTPFNEVHHIVLAGGCATIQGLDDTVSSRTQVSTTIANPFGGMELSSRINPRQLATDAPMLLIACGLSLRGFDPT
ncbi:MAG: pilus assembly protein PilM [Burkholderiales bacterium]|nr:pilus assembly protein PilM [Burkholderiales bacterium]